MLNSPVKGKIQGLFKPLSVFQVLFKAILFSKDFSRQSLQYLFDLILYVPVNNLSVTSGLVFLG